MNARHAAIFITALFAIGFATTRLIGDGVLHSFFSVATRPASESASMTALSSEGSSPERQETLGLGRNTFTHSQAEIAPQGTPASEQFTIPSRQEGTEAREPEPLQIPNLAAQISGQFEGCWQGTVDHLDSSRRLGGPNVGEWLAETLTLCFQRSQRDTLALTFSNDDETNHARDAAEGIQNFHSGSAEIMSVLTTSAVSLRLVVTYADVFKVEGAPVEIVPDDQKMSIQQTYNITCNLLNSGQTLAIQGEVLLRCSDNAWLGCRNNTPWEVGTWSAEFSRATRIESH
jgi:hypothetical protein